MGEAVDNLVGLAGTERVSGYTRTTNGKQVRVSAYTRSAGDMPNSELREALGKIIDDPRGGGLSEMQALNRLNQLSREVAARKRAGNWFDGKDRHPVSGRPWNMDSAQFNSDSGDGFKIESLRNKSFADLQAEIFKISRKRLGDPDTDPDAARMQALQIERNRREKAAGITDAPGTRIGKTMADIDAASDAAAQANEAAFKTLRKFSSAGYYRYPVAEAVKKAQKAYDKGDTVALDKALDTLASEHSGHGYNAQVLAAVDILRDRGVAQGPDEFMKRLKSDAYPQAKNVEGFLDATPPDALEKALDRLEALHERTEYETRFAAEQGALASVLGPNFRERDGLGWNDQIPDSILTELLRRAQSRKREKRRQREMDTGYSYLSGTPLTDLMDKRYGEA